MWIQSKGALSLAWLFQFTRWKTMILWLAPMMWMNFIDLCNHLSLYHLSLILSLITYTFWKWSGWTLPSKRNFILSSLHPWGSQLPIYQNKHPNFTPTVYQPFPTTFPACLNSFIFQVILSQFQGQDAGVLLQHRSQGLSKTGRNVDESNCLERFVPRF